MNSKITLMAVVLAIGAAMIIATPNAAFAKPRADVITEEDVNPPNPDVDAIDAVITTTCENPSGTNAPQSLKKDCQEQFETTTCVVQNPGGGEPKGKQDECPT